MQELPELRAVMCAGIAGHGCCGCRGLCVQALGWPRQALDNCHKAGRRVSRLVPLTSYALTVCWRGTNQPIGTCDESQILNGCWSKQTLEGRPFFANIDGGRSLCLLKLQGTPCTRGQLQWPSTAFRTLYHLLNVSRGSHAWSFSVVAYLCVQT